MTDGVEAENGEKDRALVIYLEPVVLSGLQAYQRGQMITGTMFHLAHRYYSLRNKNTAVMPPFSSKLRSSRIGEHCFLFFWRWFSGK